jgi:hypothetical protein
VKTEGFLSKFSPVLYTSFDFALERRVIKECIDIKAIRTPGL